MPYLSTGFSTVAASKAGSSPSIYAYSTPDAFADVNAAGYFNPLTLTLKVGDLIYCVTSTGGSINTLLYAVLSNAAGVVNVNDGVQLS